VQQNFIVSPTGFTISISQEKSKRSRKSRPTRKNAAPSVGLYFYDWVENQVGFYDGRL
jgi:hypothetical protein